MALDYQFYIAKNVRVITVGRVTNMNYYNAGNSLQLEGILINETDTQIHLKDMNSFQESNNQFIIETPHGTISKDKIISLYLAPAEKKE